MFGVGESDYYDKDEGDFATREFAKVKLSDDISANDVGKVVDLLNEYDPMEIRKAVIKGNSE